MIIIPEKELEDLYTSFKKTKKIIARPSNINIYQENQTWKICLVFGPTVYQKASAYCVLKPLWDFLKQQIFLQTQIKLPITWEIIRES